MGTKVKDFIAALESGEDKASAMKISGVSQATANIQFSMYNKGNKTGKMTSTKSKSVVKREKIQKEEDQKVSALPGKPIPKEKDKKKSKKVE